MSKERMVIADIGGGAGFYAFWLQAMGHSVTLIDLSPTNIALAHTYSQKTGILLNAQMGDATNLALGDNQFDLVLLLGPLYHLTERSERIKALTEARRILKPKGVVLTAVISRYASLLDGLKHNLIVDDQFEKLLLEDLRTGTHLNETSRLQYFTTAYFHAPSEVEEEIRESGLLFQKLVAIEGVGWMATNFKEKSKNEVWKEKVLRLIRMVESTEDLIAASPHIMAIARKE